MNARARKGLILAAAHVAIVASLGGKLLVDRTIYPRAWARTAPVDPNLPIRGRYVSLRVEAEIGIGLSALLVPRPADQPAIDGLDDAPSRYVRLVAGNGRLVAEPAEDRSGAFARVRLRGGERVLELTTPIAFFIPEDVADPSMRAPGEELWVEVTVPPRGAPRPIRLAVKRGDVLTPLELRPADP